MSKTELLTGPTYEAFGAGSRTRAVVVGVQDGSVAGNRRAALLLLHPLQEGLEGFECATHLLLCHVCHLEDLTEATLLFHLAAGDEDAASNDGVLRFALEQTSIIGLAVKMLGCLRCWPGDVLGVTQRGDLTEGRLEGFVRFVVVTLIVSARKLSNSYTTVTKANLRLKLASYQPSQ